MARVTVDLDGDDTGQAPRVRRCPVPEEGTSFLVLDFSPTVSVVLPGLDGEAADYARRLAVALVEAVAEEDAPEMDTTVRIKKVG